MKKMISIIVPAYNVENYLIECLESINNQTIQDFECLVIVDGATDRTFDIAKSFEATHDKFTVYWQENMGSGPARNNGLQHANGELVMFVDPDDYIDCHLLEMLVNAQKCYDYDLTTSSKQSFIDNGGGNYDFLPNKKSMIFDCRDKNSTRISHQNIVAAGYCSAPTRTLYKMSLIRKYNIEFPPLRRSQDIVFNYKYFNHICSFRSIEYVGYFYRIIPGVNVKKPRPNYEKTIALIFNDLKDIYKEWGIDFNYDFFCTHIYLKNLYSFLIVCISNNVSIENVLMLPEIENIIKHSKPQKLFHSLVVSLLNKKSYKLATLIIRIRNHFKN